MARFQETLDEKVFEQIVDRFLAPALAVAGQILSDTAAAEDAVQEALLRVVRRRERYRSSLPFANWFYAVLRNVCKDMLRRQARRARAMQDLAARRDAPAAPMTPAADTLELLAKLPAAARAVLGLRIVDQLPFRDVAAALGISEEAAKKRAQRALRRLRELSGVGPMCRPQPADVVQSRPRNEYPRRAVPELAPGS